MEENGDKILNRDKYAHLYVYVCVNKLILKLNYSPVSHTEDRRKRPHVCSCPIRLRPSSYC